MTIYTGSKGMVESFTRCWTKDLPRKYAAPPELRKLLAAGLDKIPVASRMAQPEETAWAVAMLCEEEAGWLNVLRFTFYSSPKMTPNAAILELSKPDPEFERVLVCRLPSVSGRGPQPKKTKNPVIP
ncbi:uncharacterized protein Z518_07545 [Rhinocladiella mackenziei CBS 650.93]|uniref:Uncharacterized protein n=1 Tax=Rhinocladiella mackenziei CBS 650.93 TaxID=1442369 RepID=A0A0D2FPC6_9EURO|nr:uncharacterized protein Z518_07545 [Rhinocladiella mackenziei CBS 650.93]KIX03992.1 hypothetical protein Z518_07545 [Rhinocladiella mackenziei CBS 650.93]